MYWVHLLKMFPHCKKLSPLFFSTIRPSVKLWFASWKSEELSGFIASRPIFKNFDPFTQVLLSFFYITFCQSYELFCNWILRAWLVMLCIWAWLCSCPQSPLQIRHKAIKALYIIKVNNKYEVTNKITDSASDRCKTRNLNKRKEVCTNLMYTVPSYYATLGAIHRHQGTFKLDHNHQSPANLVSEDWAHQWQNFNAVTTGR